ncbi:MAG: ATP-binding protein [Anaerolineae bacterium]|nr:ATP-binding protein [Anaerolineae bacterium]
MSRAVQGVVLSLFDEVHSVIGATVATIRCTKATLVHLSHTLENIVFEHRLPALLFTGFQESKHWQQETQRYLEMAEVAHQICIFTGGRPLPDDHPANLVQVWLREPDPLRQEWFLVIFSESFSVLLCGKDQQAVDVVEGLRQFDTLLTFDPVVIGSVLDRVEAILTDYGRPEVRQQLQEGRRRYPLPQTNIALVNTVINELIRYEKELAVRMVESEARQREAELLRAALEKERELNSIRQRLMTTLSHELRTPIATIMTSAELMQRYPQVQQEQRLHKIKQQVLYLDDMLRGMLIILNDSDGTLPFQPARIDPLPVCQRVIQQVEHKDDQRHRFVLHHSTNGRSAWLDVRRLEYILSHLLANAVKFSPPGSTITVSLETIADEGGLLRLRVCDEGMGVPPEDIDHIFEAFHRGKNAENIRGSGLGLRIVMDNVRRHGGRVTVTNTTPGACFTVDLPLHAST